ncbi:hypothetical protein VM98_38705, partial [Streptomyces rubellomurinus subsp. indigoferus]
LTAEQACVPEYWTRQAREAVRFADGVATLREPGLLRFLDLGGQAPVAILDDPVTAAPPPRDRPAAESFSSAVARLSVSGATVDWTRAFPGARRVELPTDALD